MAMPDARTPDVRARIAWHRTVKRKPSLSGGLLRGKRRKLKDPKSDKHRTNKKVAFFRYGYYEPSFRYFVEHILNAQFVALPEPTVRTDEVGIQNSNDYVCTPFKHMIGDYVEALELGADVIVQVAGPCRLGYYGELQASILRDMGYTFEMLNFSQTSLDHKELDWVKMCMKTVNPHLSIPAGVAKLPALINLTTKLDQVRDFYMANGGFEVNKGSYARIWKNFLDAASTVRDDQEVNEIYRQAMEAFRAVELDKPVNPLRIGIVGEMYTALDGHSNLHLDEKLMAMGVEVHRMLNLTNRFIHYNEPNLRASVQEYWTYDAGPTSTLTLAAAKKYAQEGFDGIIHVKSAGCTPEIDCVPALQRLSEDYQLPILYLTYDSQTSDTGLDTRLEAFYDMLAMKKARELK
jgi:predicted nucleotide-binding protein (sugar kinase/HSP70/actin superfamily)